ncbi:MAG TPA: AraC family transcriptional regulator [Allosphingosinicella sp.]|jgi:AraC-like DNA-binding protein
METLLAAVSRHADAFADQDGLARTAIPGLLVVRAVAPSGLLHDIFRPLVCLVVQGGKSVAMGGREFALSAGDSMLITADVPVLSRITKASAAAPYYALVLELDLALVAELVSEMRSEAAADPAPVRVDQTDAEVADAALRMMRLLDRPSSVPVLHRQIVREMHYWLLAGRHGGAIRHLGWPDGRVQRVARAVAMLRAGYAQPLRVEQLAEAAGMSPSSFHQHFRDVTSLSPLQFQKQLRLVEARRLMLSEGKTPTAASFAVGYASVSQFTREYRRMFGLPPARDAREVRGALAAA